MLLALQETETALTNYANELDRRAALTEARDQAANAARLSRLRFDAGADSFLTVLDAERTLAAADAALAQSDALVTTYQIALFKALAGGWNDQRSLSGEPREPAIGHSVSDRCRTRFAADRATRT